MADPVAIVTTAYPIAVTPEMNSNWSAAKAEQILHVAKAGINYRF